MVASNCPLRWMISCVNDIRVHIARISPQSRYRLIRVSIMTPPFQHTLVDCTSRKHRCLCAHRAVGGKSTNWSNYVKSSLSRPLNGHYLNAWSTLKPQTHVRAAAFHHRRRSLRTKYSTGFAWRKPCNLYSYGMSRL